MKKLLLIAAVAGFVSLSNTAFAQDEKVEIIEKKEAKEKAEKKELKEKKEKKETQEIIIRKKGDKDTKVTVEIKGDVVTINGKPLSEFKDGDITINKRDIKIWDGQRNFSFAPGEDFEMLFDGKGFGDFKTMEDKPRAFLGVTTGVENDDNIKDTKPNGAAITNVSKGSAAEKAGLKEGDIITKVNDKKVEDPGDLTETIGSFKPKDEVTVYYKRDGKEKSTKAVLGETKGMGSMSYSFSSPKTGVRSFTIPRSPRAPGVQAMPNFEWNEDGMNGLGKLREMEGMSMFPRQQKLGLKIQDTEEGNGVKVLDTDKDSPAEKAGLKKDDIVTEIGGKKITNTDEAREQLMENAEKSAYTIKAKRNGSEMSFDIKIPKKLKTANL
jgi:serine protease Do